MNYKLSRWQLSHTRNLLKEARKAIGNTIVFPYPELHEINLAVWRARDGIDDALALLDDVAPSAGPRNRREERP